MAGKGQNGKERGGIIPHHQFLDPPLFFGILPPQLASGKVL